MGARFVSLKLKSGVLAACLISAGMLCGGCLRRTAKVAVIDAAQILKSDWRFKQVEENKKFLPASEAPSSPIPVFSKNFFMQFQRSLSVQQGNTDNFYKQSLQAYREQLQEQLRQAQQQEELIFRQKKKGKEQEEIKNFIEQLSALKPKYDERITGLKKELIKQYERKKVNLELKLKTLRISEAEKTKTQKELEGLIDEMGNEEKQQRKLILQQFEEEKNKLKQKSQTRIDDYNKTLFYEATERLKTLNIKLESKYMQKQAEHQAMMIQSKGKQSMLLLSTRRFLNLLPEQSKITAHNVYTVTLQKQNEELVKTALSEMHSLIKGMARAQNYDLILANVLAAGTATDITADVKKKFTLSR